MNKEENRWILNNLHYSNSLNPNVCTRLKIVLFFNIIFLLITGNLVNGMILDIRGKKKDSGCKAKTTFLHCRK